MGAASKSTVPTHRPPITSTTKSQTVKFQARSRSFPLWLIRLCYLQHRFSAFTWLLVVTMLTVYGWTVYFQHRWNQAYKTLETLQQNERQLMSTNERLKDKLALQAQQPEMGLVPPLPEEAIVLQPADESSVAAKNSIELTSKLSAQNHKLTKIPLGY